MSRKWLHLETMIRSKLRDAVNSELQTGQPDKSQEPVRAASSETTPPTEVDTHSESVDSPSAVRTLCQAASDLKSSASKLDPKEVDKAINTLQDVLTFLEKLKSQSSKPNTAVIPPVKLPLDPISSPAIA